MKATAQIFLSYAREDEEKVENLYRKLSDAEFKPWMDKKDILPGEIWQSCIQRAIRRSDFFLACLSAKSVNRRGFLQREIKDALDIWQEMLEDDIYLIPVRLEDCEVPESLRDFQWVNLFEEDGWTRLVTAIQAGVERRAEVTKPVTAQLAEIIPVAKVEREATLYNQGVDFLLVTALEEERDAVLDKLPGYQKLPPFKDDIRTYFQAQLPVTFSDGETGNYQVIVMPLLGMGRVQAATATADAITRWHPRYIMLVGIAGGVAARGVSIGDILIADQIVDYELQKLTPQGPQVRWEVQRADPRLLNACHNFMGESWQELLRIKRPARSKPKRHTGPIASGDKVIAFGDFLERYREVWLKLIGVEMEAAGVATAAFQSSESPGFFMVRCVSDLADENKGSADIEKWRSYACDAAASFAIALLKSGPVHLLDRGPEQLPKPIVQESTPQWDEELRRVVATVKDMPAGRQSSGKDDFPPLLVYTIRFSRPQWDETIEALIALSQEEPLVKLIVEHLERVWRHLSEYACAPGTQFDQSLRWLEGTKALESLATVEPSMPAAQVLLVRIKREIANGLSQAATRLYAGQHWREACMLLEQVLKIEPDHRAAQEEYRHAIKQWQRARSRS